MRRIVMTLLVCLLAGAAQAGPIYDVQTGGYTEGDWVLATGIVTADPYNGVCLAESPYTAYCGVWVYLGSGHGFVPGDVLEVYGVYEEYYDLTEINVGGHTGSGAYATLVGSDTVPPPNYMTAATWVADGEPWEGCLVTVTDALIVSEDVDNDEWKCVSYEDGVSEVWFYGTFFYPQHPFLVGDCFNNATGFGTYHYGNYKLTAFVDGLPDCLPIGTTKSTFGGVKALYR